MFSSTEVTLSRENQKVQLFIGGTKGTFKSALNNRTWILRVHLPDDQRPNQVILNSNNVIVKDYKKETLSDSEAFLIQPVRDETMPFCGLNSPPRIQGNPVLELKITGQPVKDTIELLLLYQR